MLKLNLQFFAHKKGMGSTRNGRESESKRLGPTVSSLWPVTFWSASVAPTSIPA